MKILTLTESNCASQDTKTFDINYIIRDQTRKAFNLQGYHIFYTNLLNGQSLESRLSLT